uniref:Uncharacterized protein LOC111132992 isoform X1 n=2 Tax=Crassostrea virginica TaxID=6565 RepID=A0A8B8EB27_CRAVI|nr:uncharacterized protein LOC111132992 isoform X1 [Crassostrea virginica]
MSLTPKTNSPLSRSPHSAKMWWVVSVCLFAIVERTLGYTGCTDTSLNYQGYTYTIDPSTQQKVWSHCGFPNPSFDYALCGLTYTSGEHFLCDPDGLLTSQIDEIDLALRNIQANTSTLCSSPDGDSESFTVSIALVNRTRIADLSSASLCINNCGELQPGTNLTASSLSDSQKTAIAENFGDYLRTGWAFGSCGNDVVIFYAQDLNKVHVAVGYKASSLVTSDVIDYIKTTFVSYKSNGQLAEGLLVIAEKLRTTLRGVTPAHILLILNMIVVVLTTAFLVFVLHLRSVEFNVWGREGIWKIPEYFFYLISGVWMINGLLFGVIYMSNKAPYWATFFSAIMGIACIIMYVFEEQIFSTYSNSGSYTLNVTS